MEFDHGLEKISPDDSVTTITIGGTGGLVIPAGTTAERPANTVGLLRWNTDLTALEVNAGAGFSSVGGGASSMADGTVAAPGFAFTSEADVGFHRPIVGNLSIVANNGEQVRVIGTANAVNFLTLTGNTGTNGPVIGVDGTSTNIDIYMQPKGSGAVYAMNPTAGLVFGAFNGAGATANTQYITFTNASTTNNPYIQANGTDATVNLAFNAKSATGKHIFTTTTNNNILHLTSVTSGVNYLNITNAIATASPSIAAVGTDTNIPVTITPKGTGGVAITSGPLSVAGSVGTAGQVLTSGGPSVTPTWTTVSGGGGGAPTTAQYLTLAADATLTAERVFATSNEFSTNDGGAGGAFTLSHRRGGETWQASTLPSSQTWAVVAYMNGTFVALPGVNSSNATAYSTNGGKTWTAGTLPVTTGWLVLLVGNGTFVAIPGLATQNTATSTDGIAWVSNTTVLPVSGTWYCGCFSRGLFFMARYGSTDLAVSIDGVTWTSRVLPSTGTWQCMASDDNGTMVLMGGSAITTCLQSTNYGATWTSRTIPTITSTQHGIAYGNGVFVATNTVAGGGSPIYSTDGGVSWNSATVPAGINWGKITFGAGRFIILSQSSNAILHSSDGINWTQSTLASTNTGISSYLAYGSGVFVLVKTSSTQAEYSVSGEVNTLPATTKGLLYNDGGSINAAAGVGVSGDALWLPPSNYQGTPTTGVSMFAKQLASRVFPAFVGPSGLDVVTQPGMWRQKIAVWNPPGNATTVPAVFGIAAPTAVGTATTRNVAATNIFTRTKRLGYVSAATAGALTGHYNTVAQFTTGTGAGLGGFFYSCRFGFTDATTVAGVRSFVGMSSSTAAFTNVEPSTITNCIGVAQLSTSSTQLYIVYGGSAAQTAIPLGTNFPPVIAAGVTNGIAYDFTVFCPPNSNGVVHYRLERIGTGLFVEGSIVPGTPGTQTPSNSTLLAHRAWRTNNATAAAVGIDIIGFYIETDY